MMFSMLFKIVVTFVCLDVCFGQVIPQVNVGNLTINPMELFKRRCHSELKDYVKNIKTGSNSSSPNEPKFNISSAECLMFCGYKKLGALDADGNVIIDYLKSLATADEAPFESQITECTSAIEKTVDICDKALQSIQCVFTTVSWTMVAKISSLLLLSYNIP